MRRRAIGDNVRRDEAARAGLQDKVYLRDLLAGELALAYERVSPAHRASVVSRVCPFLQRTGRGVLRVFQIGQDEAEVLVQRVDRLGGPERD